MTCPFLWGEKRKEDWWDGFIMGQQGVWIHYDCMVILFSLHQLYVGGMMRQQRHLLLWRIEREQAKSWSHILHNVVMGGDANIMGEVFDIGHVREWIYELARAYLYRPTTLSLWSRILLMECSQDRILFSPILAVA